jgi:HK97 family phage portal protein
MGFLNIFNNFRKKDSEYKSNMDDSFLNSISVSDSGTPVTTRTALDCSVVLACVSVISNGIAQVPFRLYQKKGNTRKPAENHPLYWLFEEGPNPYQSQFEFRETLGLHLALTGEAFVWLVRVRGEIKEMYPFPPGMVNVQMDESDSLGLRSKYFVTTENGRYIEIPEKDMWHLKWRGYDVIRGLSPVKLAKNAIGLSLSSDKYLGTSLKNGVKPSGILTAVNDLTEEQRKRIRETWEREYSGSRNANKTIILSNDFRYQQMSMTNQDAQFVENRQFQVADLCRNWGVMPIMVFDYMKTTTYASSEQLFLQHKIHTLDPWYRRIETSANKFLLTEEQRRKEGLYFKFMDDGLLRGDAKSRAEVYRTAINSGYMTPNEVRALSEMNPVKGGDELFMQGAMRTVESIVKEADVMDAQIPQSGSTIPKKPKNGDTNNDDQRNDEDNE